MESQYKSRNKESLETALRVTKETEEIAASTCLELKKQGEVIDRIEDKSYQIADNIDKSERIVKGMSGFFGRVKNFFTKPKKTENRTEIKNPNPAPMTKNPSNPTPNPFQQSSNSRFKPDDEDEKYIDDIADSIENIKNMAQNISNTLDYQNKKLDVVADVTERNDSRINNLNFKTKKLMQ